MNKPLSPNQQKTRLEEFSDIVQSLDSEYNVTKQLLKALPDMEAINKWLQSGTPETYTHLYECFYRLYKRARNVLRLQDLEPIKDRCMSFVVEYLRKVAFFPTSVRTLMQLASSRRLRFRFLLNKRLEVRYVSANVGGELITLPEQPVLQEPALAALRSKCKGFPPNHPTPGTSEHLKRPTAIRVPIHCGVAVTLYVLSDKRLPALPYIGVSKLSCLACWKFLSCLRKKKPGFHTRGASGKANFPWTYPGQQLSKSTTKDHADAIYEEFYSEMAGRYTDCIFERPWSGASTEDEDLQCYEDILFQGIEGMELD